MGKEADKDREDRTDRMDEGLRQKLEGLVPEILRRTFYAGLGAVFTTEEGVRKLANEFSLPKDVATFLIQQAQSTKNDLFRIVAGELREFLESLNMNEEMTRLLTSLSFEIKTEIRFIPNDAQKPRPKMKSSVSVKRSKKDLEEEELEEIPVEEEPAEEEVEEGEEE